MLIYFIYTLITLTTIISLFLQKLQANQILEDPFDLFRKLDFSGNLVGFLATEFVEVVEEEDVLCILFQQWLDRLQYVRVFAFIKTKTRFKRI